jgi:transcriptional antiterminator Rof (Rho-off)
MERQIGINEDIIRHLTIKVDKHEDSPSMMMAGKTSYNERKPPLLVEVEKETKDLKVEKLDAVSEKIVIEEEKK